MDSEEDNTKSVMPDTPNENTKAMMPDTPNDNTKAITPGTSSERDRKVITSPTPDEILAAEGLLELSQEARVFSSNVVSALQTITWGVLHLLLKADHQILTSQMPAHAASHHTKPSLSSRIGRSEFLSSPYILPWVSMTTSASGRIPFVVGGIDRSQNISPLYPPFSPYSTPTILEEASGTTSVVEMENAEGSASPLYPPIWPYSISTTSLKEIEGSATSVVFPPLFLPFSKYATPTVQEEGKDTTTTSEKPEASKKRVYVNRNSKKRMEDESYLQKKAEVQQNLDRYRNV